ncbi:MAG TPA: hypothetical protein VIJ33_10460 [Solirubrobacteraceae bacterium]
MSVFAAVSTHTLWQVTLLIGVAVLVAVIGLMTFLLSVIKNIRVGSEALVSTAGRLEQNTATIAALANTPRLLERIKAEALVHAEFLTSKVGSR